MVFRRIPAGTFTMGSPEDELGRHSDETQHEVTLTQDFYIGVFEVTQRQWERVMGDWPSFFNNASYRESRPVERVSYNMIRGSSAGAGWPANNNVDADSFMGRLRARTGRTFDLPTESQWEYAGRAGTTTALNSGYNLTNMWSDAHLDVLGRYWENGGSGYTQNGNTSVATAKAGTYLPNAWGLYDIHGNVREWCLDWDPGNEGSYRVFRGGCFINVASNCRVAKRDRDYPDYANHIGFRIALPPESVMPLIPAPVPRTGQAASFATGDDGNLKRGVEWPSPRFTDNGDGSVRDNLTGLIWLKDANAFGFRNWSTALSDCAGLNSGEAGLTDGSVAGDWRLPNSREFLSLIDFSEHGPSLPAGHPFANVQLLRVYSTSTTRRDHTANSVTHNLALYGNNGNGVKTDAAGVWPVRGGGGNWPARVPVSGAGDIPGYTAVPGEDGHPLERRGVSVEAPRFTDNGDGTVADKLTGLVWLKNASAFGFRTWTAALNDCAALNSGEAGLTDGSVEGEWRLPNANELMTLVDVGQFNPALPPAHPFSNVQLSRVYFTSTTRSDYNDNSLTVTFVYGYLGDGRKVDAAGVWPVRTPHESTTTSSSTTTSTTTESTTSSTTTDSTSTDSTSTSSTTTSTSESTTSESSTTSTTTTSTTSTTAGVVLPSGMVYVEGGTLPSIGNGVITVSSFLMGRYEVTLTEWQTVRAEARARGYDIASGNGCASNHPVQAVSWHDVVKWCNLRSEIEGRTPVYRVGGDVYKSGQSDSVTVTASANGYRLPTDAEWEFAARSGTQSQGYEYSGGNDLNAVGWYLDNSAGAACNYNSGKSTWPVGQKAPNELGLYDMSGNVWEWCFDWHPDWVGSSRVLRGGGWDILAGSCRVAYRGRFYPDHGDYSAGFRVALAPDSVPPETTTTMSSTSSSSSTTSSTTSTTDSTSTDSTSTSLTTTTTSDSTTSESSTTSSTTTTTTTSTTTSSTTATITGDYLIVDLSAGPSATDYPVSSLSSVPVGGWTDEYKTTKLVFRRIPAGTFTMGSPTNELGRSSHETQHQVTLTQDFCIGVFEVTQRQWERVMGTWPSYFTNAIYRDSRPVERVSYNMIRGSSAGAGWPANNNVDADSFMGRLRARTGRIFDLPTDSQWEYAGRAGTTTALNSGYNLTSTGSDPQMDVLGRYWYNGGSGYTQNGNTSVATAKAGIYLPNAWGLYDIHGNVSEWCLDWFPGFAGSDRVVCAGSWYAYARSCRVAFRAIGTPNTADYTVGFRVASP
jgi:formylglycine-generating enzyme required for sulfatase activity